MIGMSYKITERLLASPRKEVDLVLSLKIIELLKSEWCNPMVLVSKKDGTIWFCIDLRYPNAISQLHSYPTPHIDDLIECLGKAKYLATRSLHGLLAGPSHAEIQRADSVQNTMSVISIHSPAILFTWCPCNLPEAYGSGTV